MDGDLSRQPEIIVDKRSMFVPGNEQVVEIWPKIKPWIEQTIREEGNYLPSDILKFHLAQQMFIFIGWNDTTEEVEMVIVAQTIQYPRQKVCSFPYVGGKNLSLWVPFYQEICEQGFARKAGCTRIVGGFREGWIKVLGYKKVGVWLMHDLA